MNPIPLSVQYCDDIIIHADSNSNKYSLIGVYLDTYPIPFTPAIVGKLSLAASFSISREQMEDLGDSPLLIEVIRNEELISKIETPPVSSAVLTNNYDAPEYFSFMFHQTINGLPVSDGDRIYIKLKSDENVLAESRPIVFINIS